jgi:putative membrane protein
MKKSLRFASAALALTLAAGCAMPAFAAGKSSFSKSETVYAVMNGDGSIKSTTVSEHLYSASGLANVTDKTTLTDIQNTESDAEFTQNGEELVWNTNDTDVYYKGNTDKALPIDVKVTYALDGQEAALEDIIGKSGHLTVTVNLKNNETGTVNVNGKDRTIVTPLITAVGVILGGDAANVTAEHGMIESAAKSSVAAFVTLPGVKDSLSGLLPDEVDSIEDYLQDTVTVEADVEDFTCPQVMVACATSTAALGTSNVFDLSSINDLTDGINQLNDAMSQLMDGASQLVDGTSQLAGGVLALLDGANTLNNGAAALDDGLGQLTNGLDTLSANNAALNAGAQQVADGVLASANKTLKEGGLIDEDMTWSNYEAVIDNILTMNDKTLAAGRKKMVRTIWEQAPSFKDSQLDLALYLSATKTNHDLEAALKLMQNFDASMLTGALEMVTNADAKNTAKAELKYQVENSQDMADVRALKTSLSQIQFFVSSVNQYTAGVQTAADGAHSAKDGSAQLAAGTKTLYDGVNTLNTGAGQLNDGAGQLNDGLNQFNEEGISKLTGALDQDQLHGLKTVLDEMTDRLNDYTSFAGAPDDAESSVKFVYKTAETVAAADTTAAETETVKEGNIFTHLWQRIVNLFKF